MWIRISSVVTVMSLGSIFGQTPTPTPYVQSPLVASPPTVGVVAVEVEAAAAESTDFFSIPLPPIEYFAGRVASVSGNTIVLTGASPLGGDIGATLADGPNFVRVVSGAQAGRVLLITGHTTNSVTVDTKDQIPGPSVPVMAPAPSTFVIAEGDSVAFFQGDTLGSYFGTSAPLALVTGGTSSANADLVSIYSNLTARFDDYYFNTSTSRWLRADGAAISQNEVVLYPYAAVRLTRRAGRSAQAVLSPGAVPNVPPLVRMGYGNAVIYTSLQLPVETNLEFLSPAGTTGFVTWTPVSSIFGAGGTVLGKFDRATSRWGGYFFNGTDWKDKSNATQNTVAIPPGGVISVLNRGSISNSAVGQYLQIKELPYTP